jgi:putative ABC transport system permease protein
VEVNKSYRTPQFADRVLNWCCKDELLEEIEGDLYEYYQIVRSEQPKWKAIASYWFHMINFLRPFALKEFGQNSITIVMYKSYFKFAIRQMWRKKMSTVFNLIGLVLAFTVCGFIVLHLQHELSYDTFHEDSENIYRVAWMNENPQTRTPHPMAQSMVKDLPEVISAVSISPIYGPGLTKQVIKITLEERNISFDEPNAYFADSTFFDVFSFKFLEGDKKTALTKSWGIVMTQSMAERYFGNEQAIGKRLSFGENTDMLEVVAVVEDVPANSHFHFNFLVSYVGLKSLGFNDPWMSWADFGHFNYVKLAPGTKASDVESKIPNWVSDYLDWSKDNIEALKAGKDKFELQSIEDIHLHSNIRWELESNSSFSYLLIYGISGLFILLISIINFVNLSTARSAERLKEVGVKKTLGAYKKQLLGQFLFESLFSSYLALLAAVILIYGLENGFNQLVSGRIQASDIWQQGVVVLLVGVATLTGILAASYPSIYLNALNPGQILKGISHKKLGGASIRNSLLAIQLVAAIVMVTGSLIINAQITFLKSKDLGFKQDNLVMIDMDNWVDKSELIKNTFNQLAGIESVSTLSNVPGGQFNQHPMYLENDPENRVDASEMFMDAEAIDVLGLEIVSGRMLDKSLSADSSGNAFLINETAAISLGLDNPVGESLFWVDNENLVKGRIVGIVKDFHYKSLHVPIRPMLMMMRPQGYNVILAKVDAESLTASIPQMEAAYAEIFPENTFNLKFLGDEIESLYKEESRTLLLTSLLSGISIFLAIAGLVGIVSIAIRQRVKEIGIRKILGASIREILILINTRYVIITLGALLVSLPISYYLMNLWLNNFTYQNGIEPIIFVLVGCVALGLIFLTISAISLKTAKSNPVNALRAE